MEFPESGRASAKKFLDYFLSKQSYPTSAEEPFPVTCNLETVAKDEIEAECMDIARTLLSKFSCPGLLNYNITAAAIQQLMKSSLSDYCTPDSNENYEGRKLTLATIQAVHNVCQKWSVELPTLVCPRRRPEFSVYAIKNTRRKMEDRHSICVDLNTLYGFSDLPYDQSLFGVFDGHIGVEAAVYASTHVHHNIARHASFLSDPVTAIKEGIKLTDERFCRHDTKAGATAVVTLLRDNKLYIGWVGDSQAMLVRNGNPVSVMDPHKPDREDEQKRIESAGGLVINIGVWRVNGNLSVSRAIGDSKEKKFVIGEADVTEITLDGTEDYIVIACDGVWDVTDESELKECMAKYFKNGGSKNNSAKHLVEFARDEGSNDNLTAIIVFFNTFKIPTDTGSDAVDKGSDKGSEGADAVDKAVDKGSDKGSEGSDAVDKRSGTGSDVAEQN